MHFNFTGERLDEEGNRKNNITVVKMKTPINWVKAMCIIRKLNKGLKIPAAK